MPTPNFYKIDCEREVVIQGRGTAYITIARNDDPSPGANPDLMQPGEDLVVAVYPQANTFETHAVISVSYNPLASTPTEPFFDYISNGDDKFPTFTRLSQGLILKNWYDIIDPSFNFITDPPYYISEFTPGGIKIASSSGAPVTLSPSVLPPNPLPLLEFGTYDYKDGDHWKINGGDANIQLRTLNLQVPPFWVGGPYTAANPFDGTPNAYIPHAFTSWARISPVTSPGSNTETNGVTFRIDFDGEVNGHIKINFLLAKVPTGSTTDPWELAVSNADFGLKSVDPPANNVDYQEIHLFGYKEDYVRPKRSVEGIQYPIEKPVYDDRASYGLIKTNPKLSGNVKVTVDSTGEIWMNSFNANDELADSAYKKFPISTNSTYQKDLWAFFKNGATPPDIVFDLYEFDDQYLNTNRTFDRQYDNFYNYGVENLRSKFYEEDFSFLAPIWLRKNVPDYFIIFRVNEPFNVDSYLEKDVNTKFNDYFKDARIVKTFDLRDSSKAGGYLRKIVNDPRFVERPLEVSWESDVATYWYGAAYQYATLSSKGEFLYDYLTTDRPIKELEEYITGGFQRNGIISTNLINMEFLFNDDEAPLYGINRYFGFYVTENQLAEFEIEPRVLGKIYNQTPLPKPGVDGEPYSTRDFIQTNPDGIQIPVNYYHNSTFTNNTSNIPSYQGLVLGKFPLPAMVDDPLRFFYIKDRNDIFKRINKLSEVDYGTPGTEDYVRATQLQLFDNQENISDYAGITDIVSQFKAELLDSGNAQMRLHFLDQYGTGVLADDEEFVFEVKRYNDDTDSDAYHIQVTDVTPSTVTVEYFINQSITQVSVLFVQPAVGSTVVVTVPGAAEFFVNQTVYIVGGGYYTVTAFAVGAVTLLNLGAPQNSIPGSNILAGSFIAEGLTGEATYTLNPINNQLSIDNYLTINLVNFGSYVIGDAWKIEAAYPSLQKFILYGINNIDAAYRPAYQQFRWRLTANGVGLQPGDAWDYPVADPNGIDFITNFSNEGSPSQVAKAFALGINYFENCPVEAWADGATVYLRSKILYEDGNSILLTRKLQGTSYYANVGYYETGNVNRGTKIVQQVYPLSPLSSGDFNIKQIEEIDQPINQNVSGYYLYVNKSGATKTIVLRTACDPSTYTSATTSGTLVFLVSTDDTFIYSGLPFTVSLSAMPDGVTELLYQINSSSNIMQFFVGGEKRLRNRAKISLTDGENYYANRRVTRTGDITLSSTLITNIDTTSLYVGAKIVGNGIPEGTIIVDVNANNIIISQPATATGIGITLNLGEISILNDTVIYQQWYQAQKGLASRMKGWNVQGKYVYSLPYIDEPVYDEEGYLINFTDISSNAVIQLEDKTQEFFYSTDKRIVAFKVYRPTLGIFSLYPIKEFDFDFIFSEYSYTPTLEVFPYFLRERVDEGKSVELPIFENFLITQYDSTDTPISSKIPLNDFFLNVEVYNRENNTWYTIEQINISNGNVNSTGVIINTFYPLYDYDPNERPFLGAYDIASGGPGTGPYVTTTVSPYDKYYQNTPAGKRNFDRRYLRTYDVATQKDVEFFPDKFRITYFNANPSVGNYLIVENFNYKNDKDLPLFNGFAGIQDIQGIQDASVIQTLKDQGKYIDAFTYQLLLSEYDRLRENFNKDFAVKSKVVPYINKWVQEGTDARDNYYRLDNSLAFGISNLSPNGQIDFAETSVLTHEFPYLDRVPKNYPVDSLEGSRSYMFAKLSDEAVNGKTWYELLTTDDTNDWFSKYFSVGYPTEETHTGMKIPKSREERYTFFVYNDGIGRSQTLFRGGKIQGIVYNDIDPLNIIEETDSTLLNEYKFAAITRFVKHDFYEKEKPVDLEIIKNDKFKSILMVITVHLEDYRVNHGHVDYMSQYFMNDILKTYNQQQVSYNQFSFSNPTIVELRAFSCYEPFGSLGSYEDNAKARPRQGFMGGGYVQLGDKKLGGIIDFVSPNQPTQSGPTPLLSLKFKSTDPTYAFNLQNEISPIQNSYRLDITPGNYPFLYDPSLVLLANSYGVDGNVFSFHTVFKDPTFLSKRMRPMISNQKLLGSLLPNFISYEASNRTQNWTVTAPSLPANVYIPISASGLDPNSISIVSTSGAPNEKETTLIEGGTDGFVAIKNFLAFGNIQALINTDDIIVEYYKIVNNVKLPATDYKIRLINPDNIIKKNVFHFAADEDIPDEYLDAGMIGYNIVQTNQQEYMQRHRGFYEPKSRDIISFWVREDKDFSKHYEKDFLLGNTHINSKSELSGLIRNYGINKVATSGEVLKISRGSAFKSLYPLIGEVAVDSFSKFALDSSWDDNFYRNYSTTTDFITVEGIIEMKETKSFLASKAMNIPKSHEMHEYKSNEVTYQLIQPSVAIGIKTLVKNRATRNQSKEEAARPKLIIKINVKERLLRQLIEDITSGNYVDEFADLQTYAVAPLSSLTTVDVDKLRTSYLEKNIINLYEVTEINLYVLNRQGIDLVALDLSEVEKSAAGYKIDKDCVVKKITDFEYEITKTLDPKVPSGFSLSSIVKRI